MGLFAFGKKKKEARAEKERQELLKAEQEKKAEEERILAEKKAEEERIAAEKKAQEEKIAAEKKAEKKPTASKKAVDVAKTTTAKKSTTAKADTKTAKTTAKADTKTAKTTAKADTKTAKTTAKADTKTTVKTSPAKTSAKTADKSASKTSTAKKTDIYEDATIGVEGRKSEGIIEIYKDAGGKFRFRVNSLNGMTVAHSQGYTTKQACKNGFASIAKAEDIKLVDLTVLKDEYKPRIGLACFEMYDDKEGKFRFRFRAANLESVLNSQGYASKDGCKNGIYAAQFIINNHKLVDSTKEKKE